MRLFTSDLDRTLIFSERTVAKNEDERLCIESYNGRNISYVTQKIWDQLTEINHTMQFVPVTTRSKEQFERILLFQQSIVPKIAIVANGGIILRNGQIDEVWQQHIAKMMANLPLAFQEVQQHFHQALSAPYFLRHDPVESLFFVHYVDLSIINMEEIALLKKQLADLGWMSYLHGRKFYILPFEMTKGAAVAYIKGQEDYEMHFAAGDSMMDVSMMYLADRSFAPEHGEIVDYPESYQNIEILTNKGAAFAEHFLSEILQIK